jgi:hypothetical protein
MFPTASKLARNQFRCFQCRLAFAQRDGDWFNWESMQVHLCKSCDKLTKERPERSQQPSVG